MRQILTALVALFSIAAAAAQTLTPCGTPAPPHTMWHEVPQTPYHCAPIDPATTNLKYSLAGVVYWGACKADDGTIWKQVAVATRTALTTTALAADVADAFTAPTRADILTKMNAIQAKYAMLPLTDPALAAVWCPYEVELAAFLSPTPAETRVVQRNGPDPAASRPTYAVVAGKRAAVSNGSVAVNTGGASTPCDCSAAKLIEGTVTYCGVKNLTATVAACVVPYK